MLSRPPSAPISWRRSVQRDGECVAYMFSFADGRLLSCGSGTCSIFATILRRQGLDRAPLGRESEGGLRGAGELRCPHSSARRCSDVIAGAAESSRCRCTKRAASSATIASARGSSPSAGRGSTRRPILNRRRRWTVQPAARRREVDVARHREGRRAAAAGLLMPISRAVIPGSGRRGRREEATSTLRSASASPSASITSASSRSASSATREAGPPATARRPISR